MPYRNAIGLIVPATLVLLGAGCISSAIYHPTGDIRHTPEKARLAYEDVSFSSRDGVKLSGWWIPSDNPRGTVLFCHGNGGNVSSCLDSVELINRLGLNLLIFDYRGYGRSGGSPSEQGTYADADAAWEYLVDVRKIPPDEMVVWGRSLGGPIAARTASEHTSGLVVLESTFTSLQELVADRFFRAPSWVLADYAHDTRLHLGKVDAPVLVIHSPDDEVVPFAHGRRLYDAIKTPKSFLQIRGDHNTGFVESREALKTAVHDFISVHLGRQEGAQ